MIHRMCETEPLRIALLAAGYGLLGLTVCPGQAERQPVRTALAA